MTEPVAEGYTVDKLTLSRVFRRIDNHQMHGATASEAGESLLTCTSLMLLMVRATIDSAYSILTLGFYNAMTECGVARPESLVIRYILRVSAPRRGGFLHYTCTVYWKSSVISSCSCIQQSPYHGLANRGRRSETRCVTSLTKSS